MNAPVQSRVFAECDRRCALWEIRSTLLALAGDSDAIASMGDRESDAAIEVLATALEGVRQRIRFLKSEVLP